MHGGLFSEDGVTLEDLRKIDRNRQPPDSGSLLFGCCKVSVATNDQEKMVYLTGFSALEQVPCVTCSGQILSLR